MPAITLYTRGYCPFCTMAKGVLKLKGVEYDEINLDEEPQHLSEMLSRSNGVRTVPQIFIGDIHVGGCDDLKALDSTGELDQLLVREAVAV